MRLRFSALWASMACCILLAGCSSTRWAPQNEDEKARLRIGEIIVRAVLLYAEANNHMCPNKLNDLVPAYLGTNIPISSFQVTGGKKIEYPDEIIVSEVRTGTERGLLLKATGEGYFLDPGD